MRVEPGALPEKFPPKREASASPRPRSAFLNPLTRLRMAAVVLAGLILVGTFGYHFIEGMSLLDSLYMTIITLSTVGYREVIPPPPAGKVFTLFLIAGGVTTGAWAIQAMLQSLLSEELYGTVSLHRMQQKIDSLRDHYIICGYGRMGQQVATELGLKQRPYVIVDLSEETSRELKEAGELFLHGDAREDEVLRRAGIDRAAGLITLASSDADNVFITLTARGLNAELDIVARSVLRGNEEKLHRAGANRVVSPYVIGGRHIAAAVLSPHVIEFLEAALYNPEVNLEWGEVRVPGGSPLIAREVVEARLRKLYGVIVVGIHRGESLMAIQPTVSIQEEDVLIVLGAPEAVREFAKVAGSDLEEASI